MNKARQIKSKKCVTDHGEVLTAEREVNAMLDLVKQEAERVESRFFEPACGTGNFLAEILRRKMRALSAAHGADPAEYERRAVLAVASIYGVDILPDNAADCRERMLAVFDAEYAEARRERAPEERRETVRRVLRRNILCADALTLKTLEGKPIVFSEWSLAPGGLLRREDFRLDEMLEGRATPPPAPGVAAGRARGARRKP